MFYIFYSWWWTLDPLTLHGKALPNLSKPFQILHVDYKQFLKKKKKEMRHLIQENRTKNPGRIAMRKKKKNQQI